MYILDDAWIYEIERIPYVLGSLRQRTTPPTTSDVEGYKNSTKNTTNRSYCTFYTVEFFNYTL